MIANDVFGSFHDALVEHWTPYLNREVEWDEAVRNMASATR